MLCSLLLQAVKQSQGHISSTEEGVKGEGYRCRGRSTPLAALRTGVPVLYTAKVSWL